jgi:CBS domain-containing protein
MKVGDVMTQKVISVLPSDEIANAIRLMLDNRISGLPVIDGKGRLVGMVTEGDLLRRAETGTTRHRARWLEFLLSPGKLAEEYTHAHGQHVDEVMTCDVVTTTETARLDTVVDLMERNRIKRLPVVRDGKVIGIVSRANLLHALVGLSETPSPSNSSDPVIRRRILDKIKQEPWGPRYSINVVVRDGRVDLWGALFEERERQALRVVAESVPGVREVHDHMAWIEPIMGAVVPCPEEPE